MDLSLRALTDVRSFRLLMAEPSPATPVLLGDTDRVPGLTRRLAACFRDSRNPAYTEHAVETLVMQRIVGIVLGHAGPRFRQVQPCGKARGGYEDLIPAARRDDRYARGVAQGKHHAAARKINKIPAILPNESNQRTRPLV